MRVIVAKDYEKISKLGSQMIVELIQKKNNAVLGLATGSTPIGMYKELIRIAKEDMIDFSKVRTFNLDEYVSVSPTHPQSYNHFMYSEFFNHINISPDNVHIPKGDNPDLEDECRQYEQKIKMAGGIDIQVLGIGSNGHIGFNEPGSNPQDRTRVVKLAESTIQDNKRFFW